MKPLAILYGSTGDNTKYVAQKISNLIPGAQLFDVASFDVKILEKFSNLILGTSTWGLGDLQDDWEAFLPDLQKTSLEGKTIAIFGLGDGSSYADTFVDGIGIIYEAIKYKNCKIIGAVSTEGYNYDASLAEIGGTFVGLPIDEDNESGLTDERIALWINDILPHFS